MKLFAKWIVGFASVVFLLVFAVMFLNRHSLIWLKGQIKYQYAESELSYRDTYIKLIQKENRDGNTFLIDKAYSSRVYKGSFLYGGEALSFNKTKKIICLLNDTSAYQWGEFGTFEKTRTIIFYDINESPIGYTLFDEVGEVENYPYRSFMKWGALSDKGLREMKRLIN
ncbi:hypothetical protein FUAX_04760 [Fulvitalea axinellae]|uniref:Lipoprotein n=1 Tax=Fulvitalea axinellae TaxID=1182444 RepID=A0AAU9D0T2_9BACT|nr:hypothetical protein FUAX_04760 [Fulvitalea axinellae]